MINGNLSFQNVNSRGKMVTMMISQWTQCETAILSLMPFPFLNAMLVVKLMPAKMTADKSYFRSWCSKLLILCRTHTHTHLYVRANVPYIPTQFFPFKSSLSGGFYGYSLELLANHTDAYYTLCTLLNYNACMTGGHAVNVTFVSHTQPGEHRSVRCALCPCLSISRYKMCGISNSNISRSNANQLQIDFRRGVTLHTGSVESLKSVEIWRLKTWRRSFFSSFDFLVPVASHNLISNVGRRSFLNQFYTVFELKIAQIFPVFACLVWSSRLYKHFWIPTESKVYFLYNGKCLLRLKLFSNKIFLKYTKQIKMKSKLVVFRSKWKT